MPVNWERVPEDIPFLVSDRTIEFTAEEYRYSLTLKALSPNKVLLETDEQTDDWIVEIVKTKGDLLQLHGFAFDVPSLELLDCWFELEVGSTSKITYWSDRVVLRTDKTRKADVENVGWVLAPIL